MTVDQALARYPSLHPRGQHIPATAARRTPGRAACGSTEVGRRDPLTVSMDFDCIQIARQTHKAVINGFMRISRKRGLALELTPERAATGSSECSAAVVLWSGESNVGGAGCVPSPACPSDRAGARPLCLRALPRLGARACVRARQRDRGVTRCRITRYRATHPDGGSRGNAARIAVSYRHDGRPAHRHLLFEV